MENVLACSDPDDRAKLACDRGAAVAPQPDGTVTLHRSQDFADARHTIEIGGISLKGQPGLVDAPGIFFHRARIGDRLGSKRMILAR